MKIESAMVKKLQSFYMLLPENILSDIIEEANIKHIKGNTFDEKLLSILSNQRAFDATGF